MSDVKIKQVDSALTRYYEFIRADPPYAQQFRIFCEDNGFDDDSLQQELMDQETVIIEFDPNFPLDDRKEKPENMDRHILTILNLCAANYERSWDIRVPRFDYAKTYELDAQFMNRFKRIFREQCPRLWTSELEDDTTYCQVLAFGYKNRFDYIQLLIDDFSRSRVENCGLQPNYSPSDWWNDHKHFYQLYNICWTDKMTNFLQNEYKIKDIDKLPSAFDMVKTAIELYDQRTHPQLSFICYKKLNTDIEIISKYIYATINMLIKTIIEEAEKFNKCVCPFQFDVSFACGEPQKCDPSEQVILVDTSPEKKDEKKENISDFDDDDDPDYKSPEIEEDVFYKDCVGDIEAKLKKNKLRYVSKENPQNGFENRAFIDLFKQFKSENKCELDVDEEFMFPYGQRLCAFVDRRNAEENNNNDTVYFYEPPENCRNIPNGVLPEWYINASKTCLLPGMNYMEELKKQQEEEKKNKEKPKEKLVKDKVKKKKKKEKKKFDAINTTIESSFHCYGQLLTLSVHVKQVDEIKCYIYYNGGIIRFFPRNDIRKILPRIFNMREWNNGKNQFWFENDLVIYDQMDEMDIFLGDKSFDQFKKEYQKWKDYDSNDYY